MTEPWRPDSNGPDRDPRRVAMVFDCDSEREQDRIREFVFRSMIRFWRELEAKRPAR